MIHRKAPICPICKEGLKPIYLKQDHLPEMMQVVGDNFLDWGWSAHRIISSKIAAGGTMKITHWACDKQGQDNE